jgi:hypothetical protein
MSWIVILSALFKPVILPILTLIVGWLIPSPMQKAAQKQAEIHNAETKATNSNGNVSDLDRLP